MFSKNIALSVQNMITILNLTVNVNGGPIWPFNEHAIRHLKNELDIYMSSENYGESGHGLNLDLLTILC